MIALGGNPDTCFWEGSAEAQTGWAVVGIGIHRDDSRDTIMSRADWSRLLQQRSVDTMPLDGHFLALRWDGRLLECFTDQLGLRTAYVAENTGGICISTRLDWVARATRRSGIDVAAFGSRWLLFNQISYESGIADIRRIGPDGYARFRGGTIEDSRSRPWLPPFESLPAPAVLERLRELSTCALAHRDAPSLGLSGGLDSRLLLAMLMSDPKNEFVTHTFGDPEDPDVRVALQITRKCGLTNHYFNDPLPDPEACIRAVRDYVAQTGVVEPCSSFLKLRYYPKLRERTKLMIDGGFGELARRQYLNRLVKLGRRALEKRDPSGIIELMRLHRADIFSRDVDVLMEAGATRDLQRLIEQMPQVEEIGPENFADLLAVRTRVPNYGGPEQARIDGEILNFMPFVQPSFLRKVFGTPAVRRSNAVWHHDTIRSLNPALARFPLAKGGVTHRFGLSTNLSWLATRAKARVGRKYVDTASRRLLSHLREYIVDIVHSGDVATNAMYDRRKILDAVSRYYGGEAHLESTVDWWLTFELWRQSLR